MIVQGLYGIAAIVALAGIGRIVFLLLWRRPVAARTLGTDYGEGDRLADLDYRPMRQNDIAPCSQYRTTRARMEFSVRGRIYREDVTFPIERGIIADAAMVLWYDPADPRRVTASGPAHGLVLILVGAGLAILPHMLRI